MRRVIAIAFLCVSVPLSAAPVPKEVKKERKLEGTWKVTALNSNGQENTPGSSYWTIDAEGNLFLHSEATPPMGNATIRFKYDPSTKAVEYTDVSPPNRNYPGLYEISDDVLKISFTLTDQTRPKAVVAGQDLNLWTFKRVYAEEKK